MDEVAGVLHVALGQEPVHAADAVLEVRVVRGHVGHVDLVVEAGPGAADPAHHEVAGGEVGHRGPDLLDHAQALVALDQEVEPVRGDAVLAGRDLLVRAVQPDPDDPDQDAPASGDVVEGRLGHVAERGAAGLPRDDRDRLHSPYSSRRRSHTSLTVGNEGTACHRVSRVTTPTMAMVAACTISWTSGPVKVAPTMTRRAWSTTIWEVPVMSFPRV